MTALLFLQRWQKSGTHLEHLVSRFCLDSEMALDGMDSSRMLVISPCELSAYTQRWEVPFSWPQTRPTGGLFLLLVGGCLKAETPGPTRSRCTWGSRCRTVTRRAGADFWGADRFVHTWLNQVHLKPPITGLLKTPAGSFISFGEVQAGLQLLWKASPSHCRGHGGSDTPGKPSLSSSSTHCTSCFKGFLDEICVPRLL